MEGKTADPSLITKPERRISGPYVTATFNPTYQEFQQMLNGTTRRILDIGCGKNPRLSWWLGSHDIWVGCDPAIVNDKPFINVHRSLSVSPGAKLAVFSDIAAGVPQFYPDTLSVVAPSQKEVVNDLIFNSDLERFLDPNPTRRRAPQTIVVALDKRTREYLAYQDEAKGIISRWMKRNRFVLDPDNAVLDDFKANSGDMAAGRVVGCWARTG